MKLLAQYIIVMFALLVSVNTTMFANKRPDRDIVILYDNDVHGAFHGYPKIAALKQNTLQHTPYVMLASMGDFTQGAPLCTVSKGRYAIEVMNRCRYDLVTLGNHEFDYGIPFLTMLKDSLDAQIILDNFTDLRTGKSMFSATAFKTFGDVTIGFIGAVTPMTQQIDSPKSYVDTDGNDIYTFHRVNFFERIQHDIDMLKQAGADYVILFSHLGDNPFDPITSEATVANTHGLDAVIDGHAHHIIRERWLTDVEGDSVILASTGCDFQHIGRFTISPSGAFTSELLPVNSLQIADTTIEDMVREMDQSIDNLPPFANTPFPLITYSIEHGTYERNCYTNLGLLIADAYKQVLDADIGWVNSGSLRIGIEQGDITYRSVLATFPHQNNICKCRFKGSRILDAIEFGIQRWPNDYGAFPVLSGIRYKIDKNGDCRILRDSIGSFIGIDNGKRRATQVEVFNRATGQYESIDPEGFYTVASNEYNLKHRGDGGILSGGELLVDAQLKDVQLFQEYIHQYLNNTIPDKYATLHTEIEVVGQ